MAGVRKAAGLPAVTGEPRFPVVATGQVFPSADTGTALPAP